MIQNWNPPRTDWELRYGKHRSNTESKLEPNGMHMKEIFQMSHTKLSWDLKKATRNILLMVPKSRDRKKEIMRMS